MRTVDIQIQQDDKQVLRGEATVVVRGSRTLKADFSFEGGFEQVMAKMSGICQELDLRGALVP